MQTEKADRIQQLTDAALAQLSEALAAGQSETLKRYLNAMARFYRYSFGNQLLIAFQRPNATHVAGFQTWKKFNRFVKRGEKGILIIAPVVRKIAEAKVTDPLSESAEPTSDVHLKIRKLVGFTTAHVFDYSQTDGQPLPDFAQVSGDPAEHTAKLKSVVASNHIALEYASNIAGAQGMSSGGKITILSGLQPAAEFSVIAHELAHELLHRGERRHQTSKKVRETEAEAVAFIVCQAINLETGSASADYIQLYSGDRETLAESLSHIRDAASTILSGLLPSS
jgi:hypothetical protein